MDINGVCFSVLVGDYYIVYNYIYTGVSPSCRDICYKISSFIFGAV
jgi:hypothetical protein